MANERIGRLDSLVIGKEATAGTEASSFTAIPLTEAPYIKPVVEYVEKDGGIGRIEAGNGKCLTKKMAEISVVGNVKPNTFGHLLTATFGGSSAPSLIETGVYKHSFSVINTNNHKSYSICTIGNDQKLSLYNMLDTFGINAEVGGLVNFTGLFKGKSETSTTGKSATYTSEECMKVSNMTVKFADNISGLAGASATEVTSLNFEITKNVLDVTETGSIEPTSFHNQDFRISGDMELVYRDDTFKDYNTAGTNRAMSILIQGDSLIGATEYNELYFEFALLTFDEWDRSNDNNAITTQTLGFTAGYDITNSAMLTGYLQNTESDTY